MMMVNLGDPEQIQTIKPDEQMMEVLAEALRQNDTVLQMNALIVQWLAATPVVVKTTDPPPRKGVANQPGKPPEV